MTDRSNWPDKVTPQHAAWVNRKLRERGERPAYGEETGKRLQATPRRIQISEYPRARKIDRDRQRHLRQRQAWTPVLRPCRQCGSTFAAKGPGWTLCKDCKAEINRQSRAAQG